jgi:hypothetical protein
MTVPITKGVLKLFCRREYCNQSTANEIYGFTTETGFLELTTYKFLPKGNISGPLTTIMEVLIQE